MDSPEEEAIERAISPTNRQPQYEGEDVSPTTSRELRGFYAYSVAAEIFAVCGVGSFLPVTLEQLARERGVLWSDRTTSCIAKKVADQGEHVAKHLLRRGNGSDKNQCIVNVVGAEITTSSFALYTFSIAVLVQALALVSFSAVADRGTYRKKLLLTFGFTGSISSALFIFVSPSIFLVGSVLVIVGVTCLGSSFVALNSFLPLLVANHPTVTKEAGILSSQDTVPLSPSAERSSSGHLPEDRRTVLEENRALSKADSANLKIANHISSTGVGWGYAAAVVVQILCILLLFEMSKIAVPSTIPLRMVLLLVGICWFVFTIPAVVWLRDRPGRPLNKKSSHGKLRSCLSSVLFSWNSLWITLKTVRQLPQVILFLVAWFLLSDAIATVSGTAILFARTELEMGTVAIALLSITATTSGIVGAFLWPIISRRFELRTNRTIVACIILMEVIPIYGLLAYLPFVKSWGVFGLQQAWEIYPLAMIHGFVMGGLSSYCRAFFGLLIPPGSEASFYALYAITDKGSSAVGPAIVGRIVDATGQIRPAFVFLAVLIALPAPLIWFVNAEKGQKDGMQTISLRRDGQFDPRREQRASNSMEAERLMHGQD